MIQAVVRLSPTAAYQGALEIVTDGHNPMLADPEPVSAADAVAKLIGGVLPPKPPAHHPTQLAPT